MQSTVLRDYAAQGLAVWAISTGEEAETVQTWSDNLGLNLPILLDSDGAVSALFDQTAAFDGAIYPQEFLIGTDGVIEYYANRFDVDALRAAIEAELEN